MATALAIEATTRAIRRLLVSAPLPPDISSVTVELYQSKNLASPMTEGVSVYLYRVAFNLAQRQRTTQVGPLGRRSRTPLSVDLSYLVTAWGTKAETQQRLLGWAMRVLEDTPILPANLLNEDINALVFQPNESIELIPDLISLQDMHLIWEIAKDKQQPSAAYVVRMVMIDMPISDETVGLVQTRILDMGGGL